MDYKLTRFGVGTSLDLTTDCRAEGSFDTCCHLRRI